MSATRNAAIPVAATLVAVLIGFVLVALTSESSLAALGAFADGAFGSAYAIGASLNRAAALALVASGFILANQANLTNVGGEGQIAVAGICAATIALYGRVDGWPLGLGFLAPALAAMLAGALWGGIAGVLKVRVGTNEVISTLLLSFIALWLVYWCVQSEDLLRQPRTSSATLPESLEIPEASKLPVLFADSGAGMHLGFPLAVLTVIAVGVVLTRSAFGVRLLAIGMNELAVRRAGIAHGRGVVAALAIAGALSGLAGASMLQGEQHVLKVGFSSGYGFDGLVIGLLARGSATGVAAAALFFGFLRSGGISMEISAGVPSAVVLIMQGLIVVAVAGSVYFAERRA
jgi:general nucleoside transport system permease protein